MQSKYFYFIFIPAILLASFALFIRIIQYEPLYPKVKKTTEETTQINTITLFADDIIVGDKQAQQTIIGFKDLGCAQCNVQTQMINKLIATYPTKVNAVWKLLNVTKFPQSTETAHSYAYCANKQQKYNEFSQGIAANSSNVSDAMLLLLANESNLDQKKLTTCLADPSTAEYAQKVELLARSLNIQAVPAFFFNNVQIRSPQSYEEWVTLLQLNN